MLLAEYLAKTEIKIHKLNDLSRFDFVFYTYIKLFLN